MERPRTATTSAKTPTFDPEKNTYLHWQVRILLPQAAYRWLPIEWEEGDRFESAFRRACVREDLVEMDLHCHQALRSGAPRYRYDHRIALSNGTRLWLNEEVTIQPLEPGTWRLVGICTDVSSLKNTQEALHHVVQSARCLMWHAWIDLVPIPDDPVEQQIAEDQGMRETGTYFVWDIALFAEDRARNWLPVDNANNQDYNQAINEATLEEDRIAADRRSSEALLNERSGYQQELRIRCQDDTIRWIFEDVHLEKIGPNRWYAVGLNTDITERKRIEARLVHQAQHDALTGLANRRQFLDALACLEDCPQRPGLLFLDLDNFKQINDTFGHAAGDSVLVHIADRLRSQVSRGDVVARLGGDEFTILLPHVEHNDDLFELIERIQSALSHPIPFEERQLLSSASIGVALGEWGQTDLLLGRANTAMRHAKSHGKSSFALYDPTMDADARERYELEVALRRAVREGEIRPHYQPIVDLHTGRVVEVEALARWATPDGAFLPPERFIPLAESTGLIIPLGASLLRAAAEDAMRWRERFPQQHLRVNVNVSERQFHQPDFVSMIWDILEETGLPATSLKIELTESILMHDTERCLERLIALSARGIPLALDDFGTGYSSLAYLSKLPVRALKIDQRFVSALTSRDPRTASQHEAIIRAIIALAQTLYLDVTAEGIETHEQFMRMRALGVPFGQGYYFATPMSAEMVFAYLESAAPPLRRAA